MWGEIAKFVGLGAADYLALPAAGAYAAYRGVKAGREALKPYMDLGQLTPYKKERLDRIKRRRIERSGDMPAVRKARRFGGSYTGPLSRPVRPKRPSKYDKWGYSKEFERFSEQSLSDVAYIGATSFCHNDLGPVVGIALIRKLMKRHYQFEYTHPDQFITPNDATGVSGTGPFQIDFLYEEVTGADVEPTIGVGYTLEIYNSTTLVKTTLSQAGTLIYNNVLLATAFGGQQGNVNHPIRRLHGYRFYERDQTILAADPGGGPVGRVSAVFPLKNQYLTCYSAVKFALQNVTPADDGSLLTTHVDVNPIKGKLMKFKDLTPRLQQRSGAPGTVTSDNSYKLQIDSNADGIIFPDVSIVGDWRQIPTARMFSNCIGERHVSLEPGEIKDYSFVFKFNGTIEKFMNGFSTNGNVLPLAKGLFGQSIMFALEKRMPTGGSNVKVNFHYESRVGCVFGKRLGALMQRGGAQGVAATSD